jgi:hypothetical protein
MMASAAEAIALVIFRSESPGANKGLRNRMPITSRGKRQSCAPDTDMQSAATQGPY